MENARSQYRFEGRNFPNLQELTEALLNEANERIIRIDLGELTNLPENRNYAKWRLLYLQKSFGERVPSRVRSNYNSLWSQLYRLEHQGEYRHPYLKVLLEKLVEEI